MASLRELIATGGLTIETWAEPDRDSGGASALAYRTVLQWDGDVTTAVATDYFNGQILADQHLHHIRNALNGLNIKASALRVATRLLLVLVGPTQIGLLVWLRPEHWTKFALCCFIPVVGAGLAAVLRSLALGQVPRLFFRRARLTWLLPRFGIPASNDREL